MTRKERLMYWQGIINKQKESGLSGAAFCKEHNINAGRFYYWRRRLSYGNDFNGRQGGFLELIPCGCANNRSTINIQLSNGILVEVGRGFDLVTLRGVIETLCSIRPCCQ